MDIPDILNEISNYLDLKSIIMLYSITLNITKLCSNDYWKYLYNRCYSDKYYKSKKFILSTYKYNLQNQEILTLHKKYTYKEYVILYHHFNELSFKINQPLKVKEDLVLHPINLFYPCITKLFMLKTLKLTGRLVIIPSSIGQLTNLRTLILSNSSILEIPKEIGKLIKLKRLIFSFNNLIRLPEEIGNLIKLTYFDCSYNNLISLPEEITQLTKLKRLYLHNNQLTILPDMSSLVNLKEITC